MVRITSLCDNLNNSKKLWSVEGNAMLVEIDGCRILFDVGRSAEILQHNLNELNIKRESIDCVVLSHGHMGHVGALRGDISFPRAVIYWGEGITVPKFKQYSEVVKAVKNEELIAELMNRKEYVAVNDVYELIPDKVYLFKSKMFSDGRIPEDIERMKIMIRDELVTDMFEEELNLCIRSEKGLVILTGCAHRGIKNIMDTLHGMFPNDKVYAVIGGTHIFDEQKRMAEYIELMKMNNVKIAAPSHCTGILGRAKAAEELHGIYKVFGTGDTLEL